LQDFVCKHILVRIVIWERLHVPELSVDLFLGGTLFDSPAGFFFTSKLKALLMAHAVFLSCGFAQLTGYAVFFRRMVV
jgi:fatty-acid desaturase